MTLATDQKNDDTDLSATSKAMLLMREEVFDLWEDQVRERLEEAREVPAPLLINTLPAFYDNIAEAVTPSYPRAYGTSHSTSMSAHGGERARMTPFRADQIIHEYQLFRDAICVVAQRRGLQFSSEEWRIVELSIDAALREAIREFSLMHEMLRERMAATLSHDMRNPLSLMLGATQLIARTSSLSTAQQVAAKIENGARRLEQMLIELVDALTVDRSVKLPMVVSRFDMKRLVETIAQEFNLAVDDKVETVAEPVTGFWCKSSLQRALENLLTNAFKYGDGGPVVVKVAEIRQRIMVSVHNSGKPIGPDQLEGIFEYLRRDDKARAAQGWGIGLPFVRSVAESHGGSVAVDSSAATGTTFIIDIPVDCRPFVKSS